MPPIVSTAETTHPWAIPIRIGSMGFFSVDRTSFCTGQTPVDRSRDHVYTVCACLTEDLLFFFDRVWIFTTNHSRWWSCSDEPERERERGHTNVRTIKKLISGALGENPLTTQWNSCGSDCRRHFLMAVLIMKATVLIMKRNDDDDDERTEAAADPHWQR